MTGAAPSVPSPEDSVDHAAVDDAAIDDAEIDHAATVGEGPDFPRRAETSGDTSVDGLTAHLADIPGLPIEDHNRLYTGLHDGLLAELNADPPKAHDAP